MPSAQVVSLRPGELPSLGVAKVVSSGRRVPGSRNEVWLCQAYDTGGEGLVLYVKPKLHPRAMLVEALAAQVGQCMGLPCPHPYVVTVQPAFVGMPRGRPMLAFGTVQIGSAVLARPILNLDFLFDNLQKRGLDQLACVFDEWIANPVRSPGDVIFDPEAGAVFIDHEAAMDPVVAPDAAVTNWLAGRMLERVAAGKHRDLLNAVRKKAVTARSVTLDLVPAVIREIVDGEATYRCLLEFLAKRLEQLDRLLCQRFLPEQAYLTDFHQKDAADRSAEL